MSSNNIEAEITEIMKHFELEYTPKVVTTLKHVAEKLTIKLLQEADDFKTGLEITANDVNLAISLQRQKDISLESIISLQELKSMALEYNNKNITCKPTCGVKIPEQNTTKCNYRLRSATKRAKIMDSPEITSTFQNGMLRFFIQCKSGSNGVHNGVHMQNIYKKSA